MDYVTPIDRDLQDQVRARTLHYCRLAEELFGRRVPAVAINFDLKGQSSGMYRVRGRQREIRYNPWIFAAHFDHCITTTVPHEVAHYVVDLCHGLGNVRPHGREWKQVMVAFGADASVTADLALDGVPRRRRTLVAYRCACGDHPLGVRRHRKVMRGEARYSCRRCGQELVPRE